MGSWGSLLKKEIRLGVPVFLIPMIAFVVVSGIAFLIGARDGVGFEAITGVASIATTMLVFYLPYYLFYSLQTEKKRLHLWLHNPMPATLLVTAKFVSGLLALVVTLIVTVLTLFIAYSFSNVFTFEIPWDQAIKWGLWGLSHLVLFSIVFSIWLLLFWMINLMFTRYLNSFVSFLSTFILFIVTIVAYGWFTETWFYDKLTKWGELSIGEMMTGFNVEMGPGIDQADMFTGAMSQVTVFTGSYLFEAIISLLLFFAACWILDRKVEV